MSETMLNRFYLTNLNSTQLKKVDPNLSYSGRELKTH